jgi:N-acetylglucosaminyl-diphospho-decaprenol L-rhamnosyltransferase
MTAVEAVVVDYNAGDRLRRCVASLQSEGCAGVVVVDNSTRGASRAVLGGDRPAAPGGACGVEIVESAANGGFGAGANLGVARTSAAAVLICNPDIELRPGALQAMRSRLDDGGVAVVAPALLDNEGRRRPGARPLPTLWGSAAHAFLGLLAPDSRAARRHRRRQAGQLAAGKDCWVPGACLLVRREAFSQVKGFDESFFLYLEEVDLCRRLAGLGWRVAYEPGAEALHVGGVSTSQRPVSSVLGYHASLWRYARRAASGPERVALPLVAVGIALRCGIAAGLSLARSPTGVLAAPAPAGNEPSG